MDPDQPTSEGEPVFPLVDAMYPVTSVFFVIPASPMVNCGWVYLFNPVADFSSLGIVKAIMNMIYLFFNLLHISRDLSKKGQCEGRFVFHRLVK